MAHITGGGLIENIPRVLPSDMAVVLNAQNFNIPPVFGWIAESANLSNFDILRTFNCGIGMVIIVSKNDIENTLATLVGQLFYVFGEVMIMLQIQCCSKNFNYYFYLI